MNDRTGDVFVILNKPATSPAAAESFAVLGFVITEGNGDSRREAGFYRS
jgi:hypothetical protein